MKQRATADDTLLAPHEDAGTGVLRGARELAEDRIRQGIVAGEFLPGMHLSERALTEITGASRAVVREAIRSLEGEGLITVVRYRGPTVTQLTEKEARDIYELRAMLEGRIARLFTQRADDAAVAALAGTVDDIGQGHATGDMVAVIESSGRFYDVLVAAADNGAIAQTLRTLLNRLALFRFSSTRWPGRASASMEELRAFVAAVQARDAEAAEREAVRHIESAAEMALLVIAERQRGAQAAERAGRRGRLQGLRS